MRILVTGGTGIVGRTAVAWLVDHQHEVRVIGRRPDMNIEGAEYRQCDVTDYDRLCEQMKDMEAVVHLAAIPHPAMGAGKEIFYVNCAGTFNIYEAAASKGIRRVVAASSINALGYPFGIKSFPLAYFPIDEEHPTRTTDPYSFSKQIVEEIAAYHWRREGISSVCLRLPAVLESAMIESDWFKEMRDRLRRICEQMLALPPDERTRRVREVTDEYEALRRGRAFEEPKDRNELLGDDMVFMIFLGGFWTYIDARDSAQAIEKGLLADYEGSHPLYVNASDNLLGLESKWLIETFYPEVTTWRRPVKGSETLVSFERARKLIGFEPEYLLP